MSIQKWTSGELRNLADRSGQDFPSLARSPARGSIPIALPGSDQELGVWSCEVGSFARAVETAELMLIVQGKATFTTDDGQVFNMSAGDTLLFPAHTKGQWNITERLMKFFVTL